METWSFLDIVAGNCSCRGFFDCTLPIDNYGGVFLWLAALGYMFKALATVCVEYFAPSLDAMTEEVEVSPDLLGATVVALGASAAELCSTLLATLVLVNAAGVGLILGSGIFNVLLVVGLTGVVACKEGDLTILWYPLFRDFCFYFVAMVEFGVIVWDEQVHWWEGLIMLMTYAAYCLYMRLNRRIMIRLRLIRKEEVRSVTMIQAPVSASLGKSPERQLSPPFSSSFRAAGAGEMPPGATTPMPGSPAKPVSPLKPATPAKPRTGESMASEPRSRPGSSPPVVPLSPEAKATDDADAQAADDLAAGYDIVAAKESQSPLAPFFTHDPLAALWLATIPTPERHCFRASIAALFFVACCSYMMLDLSNRAGAIMRVPPLVMGLFVLGPGTSLSKTVYAVAVAREGDGAVEVANTLGSGVFDILVGLGLPWFLGGLAAGPVGFEGQRDYFLAALAMLGAVTFGFLIWISAKKWRLTWHTGVAMMAIYAVLFLGNFAVLLAGGWKFVDTVTSGTLR